ncbi:hypothetical protein HU200_008900 [Digitaria exilis]|uniref:Uncharacterized protein n=1 Tax=Digitaria exilis TaxID=1010633 RepID=A0A835KTA3_9POAL|nr:hypothetical protein HU200_008900 [Digitaria exilis]
MSSSDLLWMLRPGRRRLPIAPSIFRGVAQYLCVRAKGSIGMGQQEEEEAVLMPPAASVVFSWEKAVKACEPAVKAAEGRRRDVAPVSPEKQSSPPQPPAARRLYFVPPPPGRAPATRARAVRPEDDPFLAAYLACTKSSGRRGGGAAREEEGNKGRGRRFTWAGLGLSCKSSAGAVEQSMLKLSWQGSLWWNQPTRVRVLDSALALQGGAILSVRGACGDFVNLKDLPAQSFGGAYRGRVACVCL